MSLLSPAEYQAELAAAVGPLAPRTVSIADAVGAVLARDVHAVQALPGFDNSAMDGYAVRAADVPGAGVILPVAGIIAAGDTRALTLESGTAWQIMTGAPVPTGADSVIEVERTDAGSEQVRFDSAARYGASIRRMGEDVRPGDRVLTAGTRVGARHIAALAGSGVGEVSVVPRPRVAVISTGDELRPVGTQLAHGQIIDTNAPMLAALVQQAGFEVSFVGNSADSAQALLSTLEQALPSADAIITSGGVSAGEFEPLKAAFEGGSAVEFRKIAMQPGKPQGFGFVGSDVPLFALPGNPVSSLVSFVMFVAPALRVMAGRVADAHWHSATAARDWTTSVGRAQIARVNLTRTDDGLMVEPSGGFGSHLMGGLAAADALAWIDADVDVVHAGDAVRVISLDGEFA